MCWCGAGAGAGGDVQCGRWGTGCDEETRVTTRRDDREGRGRSRGRRAHAWLGGVGGAGLCRAGAREGQSMWYLETQSYCVCPRAGYQITPARLARGRRQGPGARACWMGAATVRTTSQRMLRLAVRGHVVTARQVAREWSGGKHHADDRSKEPRHRHATTDKALLRAALRA